MFIKFIPSFYVPAPVWVWSFVLSGKKFTIRNILWDESHNNELLHAAVYFLCIYGLTTLASQGIKKSVDLTKVM